MSTGSSARGDELADRARTEVADLVDRASDLAVRARTEATPYVERVQSETAGLVAAAAPLVESAVETVTGVLEDAGARGGAAWAALRSDPRELAGRRWRWTLGAALAGATAGAAVAYAVGRLRPPDPPDALEPEQLRAVVDRPQPALTT